jgi:hypothetical protein
VCSSTSGVITSTSVSASTASQRCLLQLDRWWLLALPWYARVRKPWLRPSASSHCYGRKAQQPSAVH